MDDINTEQILRNIHQLRLNSSFKNGMAELITSKTVATRQFVTLFTQHFVSNFALSFFGRQAELATLAHTTYEAEPMSDNDQQVLFYICVIRPFTSSHGNCIRNV